MQDATLRIFESFNRGFLKIVIDNFQEASRKIGASSLILNFLEIQNLRGKICLANFFSKLVTLVS
jgi:hypothetical protein